MALQRIWLDWNKPCLPAAADWLITTAMAAGNDVCDLRRTVCVLPGSRAGRVLLAQLIQQCESRTARFIPPRVLTPGALLDALLDTTQPMATDVESILAWIQALQSINPEQLRPLLPTIPATKDLLAWQGLAEEIHRLHTELAGAQRGFEDAALQAEEMEMFAEGERWRTLQAVADRYVSCLRRHGLVDAQRSRQSSLRELAGRAPADSVVTRLVLIAVTDLNAMQRLLVQAFADGTTALVHAPNSMSERFDSLGCVIPAKWAEDVIEIDDDQICIVDRPDDQAQHALRSIAALDGQFCAEQITIGLGDEQLAPTIIRHGEWAGVGIRSAAGRPLTDSAPARFLAAASDYLRDHRFARLAALLRHPDVEAWLIRHLQANAETTAAAVQDWLSLLDEYFCQHLHERFTGGWLGNDQTRTNLKSVHDGINALLSPLASSRTQPLSNWAAAILEVLNSLYAGAPPQIRNPAMPGCELLRDLLIAITAIVPSLQPKVDAATAVQTLLHQAAGGAIPEELEPVQIELLGWLELHLDLADALIITGCNDGQIPQTTGVDPFLPDSLRSRLGLNDSAARYGRDCYLLQAILKSRPNVTLITGRRGADGDSLSPSRLLLACEPDRLVNRIQRMCGEHVDAPALLPIGLRQNDRSFTTQFTIPKLDGLATAPDHMAVTEFKTYIECPYRYALGKLLKLEGFNDDAVELDPLLFGSLAHEVLCDFGNDPDLANSIDADAIERGLIAILERHQKKYGASPLPAIQVQMSRLRQRLRSFAEFQAGHRVAGWTIKHCELHIKGRIELDVPGQKPMPLTGRIDRVDFNEQTGQWLIADYKTGESAKSPAETHHQSRVVPKGDEVEWFDLQLPLYRHLAPLVVPHMPPDAAVQVGYICLSKNVEETAFVSAEWADAHIQSAIERARKVIRSIRAGEFEINPEYKSDHDAFARICQMLVPTDSGETADEGEAGD